MKYLGRWASGSCLFVAWFVLTAAPVWAGAAKPHSARAEQTKARYSTRIHSTRVQLAEAKAQGDEEWGMCQGRAGADATKDGAKGGSLAGMLMYPKELGRFFPPRSLAIVLMRHARDGLGQWHKGLRRWGLSARWQRLWRPWKERAARDLGAPLPQDLGTQLKALGIAPTGEFGAAVMYSRLMRTFGLVVVARIHDEKRLHKMLQHSVGYQLSQGFRQACEAAMQRLAKRLRLRRRTRGKTLRWSTMRYALRGASFFSWCATLRSCESHPQGILCKDRGSKVPFAQQALARWKQPRPWRRIRQPFGWVHANRQQDLAYAIVAGKSRKYAVLASHPYFLRSAMRQYQSGKYAFFSPFVIHATHSSRLILFQRSIRRMLMFQSRIPGSQRASVFTHWPSWMLGWTREAFQGVLALRAVFSPGQSPLYFRGDALLPSSSAYRQVLRAKAGTPARQSAFWLPKESKWFLVHNVAPSWLQNWRPRNAKRASLRNLFWRIVTAQLGAHMSIAELPAPKGGMRLLVQLQLRRPTVLRGMLATLWKFMRKRTRAFQKSTVGARSVYVIRRAKAHTRVAYTITANNAWFTLESKPHGPPLLKALLLRKSKGERSLLQHKAFTQRSTQASAHHAFFYVATPAAKATSQPTTQPKPRKASPHGIVGTVTFDTSRRPGQSPYRFRIHVQPLSHVK